MRHTPGGDGPSRRLTLDSFVHVEASEGVSSFLGLARLRLGHGKCRIPGAGHGGCWDAPGS